MGADGHIVICKRADFEEANPGVDVSECIPYSGTFLGEECIWGYFGDNLYGANYGPNEWCGRSGTDYTEAELKAIEWFDANAETHEVWT